MPPPDNIYPGKDGDKIITHKIDAHIGSGDMDIYVEGQLVLHIGQVSDNDTINLFFYPKGTIIESMIHQEDPTNECTHELLVARKEGR